MDALLNMTEIPIVDTKRSEELTPNESNHIDDATNLIINYLPVDLDETNLKVFLTFLLHFSFGMNYLYCAFLDDIF